MGIPLKLIDIPNKWNVYKNDFYDIEPNNTLPINDIFWYFCEDILQANYNYNGHCIDLRELFRRP
jgi:hypothetical protein